MENYSILSQVQEILPSILFLIVPTALLCLLFASNIKIFYSHDYQAVQKIHDQPVSRLGGLAIFITFGAAAYFFNNTSF